MLSVNADHHDSMFRDNIFPVSPMQCSHPDNDWQTEGKIGLKQRYLPLFAPQNKQAKPLQILEMTERCKLWAGVQEFAQASILGYQRDSCVNTR